MQQTTTQTVQKKKRARSKLIEMLKEIFGQHVGLANGITHNELLNELYGEKISEYTKYQRYYVFNARIAPALRWLRANTKYFIVAQHGEKTKFFVVETLEEFAAFKDKSLRNIDGIQKSIDRCERAVNEAWSEHLDEGEE